jgi:hypothetical protein
MLSTEIKILASLINVPYYCKRGKYSFRFYITYLCDLRLFLCFPVLRSSAGRFWARKLKDKKRNTCKKHLFREFSLIVFWMQRSCNVHNCSSHPFPFYTLWSISFADEWNITVSRPNNMQTKFCFLKLVCFFPWLAGRFHNFALTVRKTEKNKK